MAHLSRRDFLKLSASAFASLGFSPFLPSLGTFDDSLKVRVATKSVSVYLEPDDQSLIVGQHFRDELLHVYKEVDSGTPLYNPIWYRVWGGYIHRARLQKVEVLFNEPLRAVTEGTRQPAELTVPYTQAMRYTKMYGWQPNLRLHYGSVHWIDGIEEGPDGEPWYRIYDELVGVPITFQRCICVPCLSMSSHRSGLKWHWRISAWTKSRRTIHARSHNAWMFVEFKSDFGFKGQPRAFEYDFWTEFVSHAVSIPDCISLLKMLYFI